MAGGGHGLPKVSPGPAMLHTSRQSRQTTPEMAIRPFQGWPACRKGGLRPSSTPFGSPCHTAMDKSTYKKPHPLFIGNRL
jgi:hypothetical protein